MSEAPSGLSGPIFEMGTGHCGRGSQASGDGDGGVGVGEVIPLIGFITLKNANELLCSPSPQLANWPQWVKRYRRDLGVRAQGEEGALAT